MLLLQNLAIDKEAVMYTLTRTKFSYVKNAFDATSSQMPIFGISMTPNSCRECIKSSPPLLFVDLLPQIPKLLWIPTVGSTRLPLSTGRAYTEADFVHCNTMYVHMVGMRPRTHEVVDVTFMRSQAK